jgi:PAS domain S-box-containing protein
LRDITEQRQAEEALRESEEKYRLLFENATQSIAVVQDYKIQFANPKCYEVLGFSMEELLNKPFSDFVYPDDNKVVYENYLKRIQGKPVPANVFRVLRKDQLVRWVEESGVRIKWHGNDASLIFLSDLTIRKKAEEELNNSLEELHQLTQHMQEVREQERMGISRELHDDLGQALTAVKIDLGIIKQEVADQKTIQKIEKVSSLVSDTIKTVQRLTSNLRPDIIDDLGLETAIEWYTKEYAQRSGVKVFLTIDPGIEFSPNASLNIFRIIQESLTNISRHSKATQVDIRLKKTSESYIFVISDNGIGISENEIKSKRSFGLMSMKERAVSFGGTLDIYNNKKNGTEIKIIIPIK